MTSTVEQTPGLHPISDSVSSLTLHLLESKVLYILIMPLAPSPQLILVHNLSSHRDSDHAVFHGKVPLVEVSLSYTRHSWGSAEDAPFQDHRLEVPLEVADSFPIAVVETDSVIVLPVQDGGDCDPRLGGGQVVLHCTLQVLAGATLPGPAVALTGQGPGCPW